MSEKMKCDSEAHCPYFVINEHFNKVMILFLVLGSHEFYHR